MSPPAALHYIVMKKRIIFGAIMIAVIAGVLLLDWSAASFARASSLDRRSVWSQPLGALVLLLTVAGFLELSRLARAEGTGLLVPSGLIGSAVIATFPVTGLVFSGISIKAPHLLALLGLTAMLMFLDQMRRRQTQGAMRRIGLTALAVVYLGVGGAIVLTIRLGYGVSALVLFLAAVKFTDIGAYFTGSFFGRHKLIPWLSPGKSWEGLAGGVATSVVVSVIIVLVWPDLRVIGAWRAALFGAIIALAGQFADLCESLLKRSAGLKDSGSLVPDFGGVLDIIDSPLLAAPVALLLFEVIY